MKQNKRIPRLRFPDFENSGEWEGMRLGEIGNPLMCKRILKEQTTINPSNGVPFYKIGTFGKDADAYIPTKLYEEYKDKYSFPKKGDILVSASGTIGRLVVYNGLPAYFQDSNIVWLDNNEKIILNTFLFHIYSNINWQTSDGGIIRRLYNTDFKKMQIVFPKNTIEQQKIASVLSSLDELITDETNKLAQLQTHKKGLMQNLFPQEGEKVPKLRFKEFEHEGEWEETTLEIISPSIFDGTHQTPKYTESGVPFFSVENIVSKAKNKFISQKDYLQATRINKPEKGDIIITRIGKIGFTIVVDWDYDFSIYVTLAIIKQSERFISHFLCGFLQSETYQKEILSKSLLYAVPMKINMIDLRKTAVVLPPTISEQQKIADTLSSLDKIITAQTTKIDLLKEHKKGLMQALFPG